ncbi:MAG: hypothetical protein GXO79_12970, partial [Chlorobi bacterium]|nr:hypothetical protein [Chlorobiota bacterium]
NNTYTNDTSLNFQWRNQTIADFYRFKLLLDETVILDENLETNSVTLPDDIANFDELVEGEFTWQVQALNDISQSSFTSAIFTIDRTNPGKPNLQSPLNNDTVSVVPVTLKWERPSTSGSPIKDNLLVYSDSITNNPIIDIVLDNSEYALEVGNGVYFWTVQSVDLAGNESEVSQTNKFVIAIEKK